MKRVLLDPAFWVVTLIALFLTTVASWSFMMVAHESAPPSLTWDEGDHHFTVVAPDGTDLVCVPADPPGRDRLAYACTQVPRD